MEFIRFAGTINTHEEKKVAKATVNVILENCTGTFYIADIMFQEGKWLTGYVVNNLELLQKNRVDGEITPVRFLSLLLEIRLHCVQQGVLVSVQVMTKVRVIVHLINKIQMVRNHVRYFLLLLLVKTMMWDALIHIHI